MLQCLDKGSGQKILELTFISDQFRKLIMQITSHRIRNLTLKPLFLLCLGAFPPLALAEAPLTVEPSVSLSALARNFTNDANVFAPFTANFNVARFSWLDSQGKPRSAAMTPNTGGADAAGRYGGYLLRYTYQLADTSIRTVNATPQAGYNSAGGFGYVVSHLETPSLASSNGEDDSPLSHLMNLPGRSTTTLLAGRHHAIHEYKMTYPRWGSVNGFATKFQVPITLHWFFATGRDHPVWSITYDLSAVPAGAVVADSRAPYGEMAIDGKSGATIFDGDTIGQVGWGETKKFRSGGAALTLNSPWDWTANNTIPHVFLKSKTINAEMGLVQTQPHAQKAAGGYAGYNRGGSSSAAGSGCPLGNGNFEGAAYNMPCINFWPYQSVNFGFYDQNGFTVNGETNGHRLAWGTNWGAVGRTAYADRNGVQAAGGHPYQSYAVNIVLGEKSGAPSDASVTQMEAVHATNFTATVGTVAGTGAGNYGPGANAALQKSGWNASYGTWQVAAAANAATINLNVASGTLQNPVLQVTGYTLATAPSNVKFNNVALTADTDYFASVGNNTLFLTLKRNLTGTTNKLEFGAAPGVRLPQTITFAAIANRDFSATPTPYTASASSGLQVFMFNFSPTVCTVNNGNTITDLTAGTCSLLAVQAGDAQYVDATSVANSFVINRVRPAAPTNVVATPGTTSISLSFVLGSNGGAPAQYSGTCVAAGLPTVTVVGQTSPYLFSGLVTGASYVCSVRGQQSGLASSGLGDPGTAAAVTTGAAANIAVTPSAGANGSISPSTAQSVASGGTAMFTAVPTLGFVANVAGTCGGALVGNTFTTNRVNATCTVSASFSVDPAVAIRYRIYIPSGRGHLYTTDVNEYNFLTTNFPAVYQPEGIAHKVYKAAVTRDGQTTVPFYRLFIKTIGQHFWTTDQNEYNVLRAQPQFFGDDGIDSYLFLRAGATGAVPLYRLVLANTPLHVWTTNANEFDFLSKNGWIPEGATGNPVGVTGYVLPK